MQRDWQASPTVSTEACQRSQWTRQRALSVNAAGFHCSTMTCEASFLDGWAESSRHSRSTG